MASSRNNNSTDEGVGGGSYKASESIVYSKVGGHDPMTIKKAYGMDNNVGMEVPDAMGGTVGGSDTNLAHSLTGASAVMTDGATTKTRDGSKNKL